MLGACAGLRVLDLTEGLAGPLATMILADFGAEVIRVETRRPTTGLGGARVSVAQPGQEERRVWTCAHRPVEAEIARLVPTVDVVVSGAARQKTCDTVQSSYEALSALNPALVYCAISGFGRTGPLAGSRPRTGWPWPRRAFSATRRAGTPSRGGRSSGPAGTASYFAAMLAVQGILAALRARDLTGEGQLVSTTLLQALTCRQNPKVRWLLRERRGAAGRGGGRSSTPKQDEAHTLAAPPGPARGQPDRRCGWSARTGAGSSTPTPSLISSRRGSR